MVFVIGSRWPYNCCFVGSYFLDLFNIVRSILLQLPSSSSLFSICFVSVQIVHHTVVWTRPLLGRKCFLFYWIDVTNSLSIAVHVFTSRILMSFFVDETLVLRLVNLSTSFREPPFKCGDVASLIKAHVLRFVCVHMETYAACCLIKTMR